MFKFLAQAAKAAQQALAIASGLLATADVGCAQSYNQNFWADSEASINAMKAQVQGGMDQMQMAQNQLIAQAMADPQCQQAYRQYQAQRGYAGTFQQFAFEWVATAQFSPGGAAQFMQSEGRNQAREQGGWQGLQNAAANAANAMAQGQQHFSNNMQEAGTQLQGNATYINPYTGQPVAVASSPQAGPQYDPATGYTYYIDQYGNHQAAGQNGWQSQMQAWQAGQPRS